MIVVGFSKKLNSVRSDRSVLAQSSLNLDIIWKKPDIVKSR
jgi:hypothetical protein